MVSIARETIERMFDDIRHRHRWNADEPLLWGYFFIGRTSEELERAARLLVESGYKLVGVFLEQKERPDQSDRWWLHIERVEHHSIDTLIERNAHFNAFAEANHLICYDGMDVGPAPQAQ